MTLGGVGRLELAATATKPACAGWRISGETQKPPGGGFAPGTRRHTGGLLPAYYSFGLLSNML